MTVIVCLDNANGMMFNHRRQSRDANVVKDILKTINGASLLIAPYSEPLFSQAECSVSISDSFLVDAGAEDYCFVENTSVAEFKEKISKLVIYVVLEIKHRSLTSDKENGILVVEHGR